MEAVAISAAKSTLNLVVKIAAKGITQEFGLLLGVQEELLFIKQEFEMLQAFLQDDSMKHVENDVITTWIQHVKELAMDLEDCLQEASIHLIDKSCLLAMCSVKERDRIARKIRALKVRTSDVINRKERYYRFNESYGGHTNERIASTRSITNVEVEAVLVGLDKPKRKLVELILKDDGEVISVVGMGGLGKTTLVKEVYGCQELRNVFNNHCAWVTIQHPFNKDEFIESLAKQLPFKEPDYEGGGNKNRSEELSKKLRKKESLEKKVKEYLKDKKYLIVLDDLSSVPEWDEIKDVLSPNIGSRIIVTTREKNPLAEHISHPSENIYEINELSKHDALDLFFKAVYKTANYPHVSGEGPRHIETTEGDSKAEGYSKAQKQCITEEEINEIKEEPPHENKCNMENGSSSTETTEENSEVLEQCKTKDMMKTHAGKIVERCGRIPLAIVTIGSYLATKPKTSAEWYTMHDHLRSELANNQDLGVVENVLISSYDGMPKQLKPCLLYLSVFHNHKEIRRSKIIRRWMADEVIKENHKKMVEDIGKDYFYDLMWRSLIQPSQMSTFVNGDIQRCNIHDMIYKLILEKAVDEGTVLVIEDGNPRNMPTVMMRNLVIIGEARNRNRVLERMDLSHMRYVSIFGMVGDCLSYCKLKLVKVLDLEGTFDLHNRDLRSVAKLSHLKYLGLRGTKITKLPNSLGKLSKLETLDIRDTKVVELPTGLTKLHKLSYLHAGSQKYFHLPTPIQDYFFDIIVITKNWQEKVIDKCLPTIKEMARSVSDGVIFLCFICCLIPIFPCVYSEMLEKDNVNCCFGGVRVPRGIGKLRSLNIFGTIDIGGSKSLAKDLENLTNLTKLAVTGFTKKNGKTLANVIDGLKQLRSLVLSAADDFGLRCCLDSVSYPPKYLQSLKLYSRLGKLPDWISSLDNLKKIHFRHTHLIEETRAIGKLPNLKILYMLDNSFNNNVNELCFGEGMFPMLKVMILEYIYGLESVLIEKTALKRLEMLKIRECWDIREDGVSGLEFLVQLKEMEVVSKMKEMGLGFHQRTRELVRNMEEQLKQLPKEPVLKVQL